MPCIRPATPGFLVTLTATILLAIVSFCVPYFKSVYFLKADFNVGSNHGSITFGTLGYCLELANGTTCSKPSIGYQLDINSLVGNKFKIQIPEVVVKWITYALFLHIVGLALAAGSAVFGLLAHVREMSMACCSTCVSGFAAGVTLLAFIFDLVLFFVAKARINAVGHASMGIAIWLTLAAWILLFFSGCFFALGRCCISKRGNRNKWGGRGDQENHGPDTNYAEQMRMEAVKAEAERKAKQAGSGGGLPAFYEVQPLVKSGRVEGDTVYTDYKDENSGVTPPTVTGNHQLPPSGYAPAPRGTRAVDDYFTPTPPTAVGGTTYPPRPQAQGQSHPERQGSGYSYTPSTISQNAPRRQASGYTQAAATAYSNAPRQTSPPPANNQYLSATGYQDPYASGPQYGHAGGGSSYHTAASHGQQPSSYSPYNNYAEPPPQPTHYSESSFDPETYNNTGILNSSQTPPMPAVNAAAFNPYISSNPANAYSTPTPDPYTYSSPSPPVQRYTSPDRQYTLSGDGYGANSVPPLQESSYYGAGALPSNNYTTPINTDVAYGVQGQTSPLRGPLQPSVPSSSYPPEDSPPEYDVGGPGPTGQWGKH